MDERCDRRSTLDRVFAKVLTEHLNLFVDLSDKGSSTEIMVEKDDKGKEKVLEMTIEELDLSVRSFKLSQARRHQHCGGFAQQV